MSDIGFALNYTQLFQIDVSGTGAKDMAWLAGGISEASPSGEDITDDTAYFDGMGVGSMEVTGGSIGFEFSGHRRYGDRAQDYIASIQKLYGQARHTFFRWITSSGDVFEGDATIANIVATGGAANEKQEFSCTIMFNGMPNYIASDTTKLPDSLSAQESVAVKVGGTANVGKVTATPSEAVGTLLYFIEDHSIAKVSADGVVTGVKEGETNLTIKSAVNPSVGTSMKVVVSKAI